MPYAVPKRFGVYPGGMGKYFGPAAWQFARDIQGPNQGGPYAAAGADQAAQGYYADSNNMPSFADMITGAGSDVFRQARLAGGIAGADTAGVNATNQNRNAGIKGTLDVNNARTQAIAERIRSQMGLEFAQNQKTDQGFGILGGALKPFLGQGGMLTGGPGSPGAIPQIIGGQGGMPNMNIFSKLLGPGGLMGMFQGGGAGAFTGLGAGLTGSGGMGLTDLIAALGSGGAAAGGGADIFATLMEAAPLLMAA